MESYIMGMSAADKIKDLVTTEHEPANESEKISANARVVILGLFTLVAFLTSMFTLTTFFHETNDQMIQVYTAAITGSFTLGGVLITQLWGK
jgi:hypothetical protein